MERYNISKLLSARRGQQSFHVASEEYVRVEFRNMSIGEELEAFRYGGNVVLTVLSGKFELRIDGNLAAIVEMDQVITVPNEVIAIKCQQAGAIQLIWSPPYASAEKISGR